MLTGIVKFFNQKTKFGFIIDDTTKKEYYVHSKNIEGTVEANDKVSFELKPAARGEECVHVKKITDSN